MGDFFLSQPGGGAPPPEPDIPAPDFKQVGQGISAGFDATDFWGRLLKKFVDTLGAIVAGILAAIVAGAAWVAARFVDILTRADENSNAAYGQLTAATLEHLFGVQINPSDVAGRGDRGRRVVAAKSIGDAVFKSLFAAAPTSGAGGLQPSSSASEQYLQTVIHLGLEGWMETWIVDALSLHDLQRFGELKDVMAEMLGLSRLTRRVLAPPMKILVEDPYTWLLNDRYRPTLLPHELACRQFLRGAIQRDQLDQILGWQGWSPANIDYLINSNRKFLALQDLDYQIQRGLMTQLDAVQYLQDQGWERDAATIQVSMLHDKRIDVYRKDLILAAETAFVAKDIDIDQFQQIVLTSGLPDEEQTWLIKVAGMKREMRFKRLTLGEVETMIKAGIMNVDDLRAWMVRENYRLEDMQNLELLLIDQTTTAAAAAKTKSDKAAAAKKKADDAKAAAQAKQKAAAAQLATKGISLAEAKQLVKDRQWTFDQYSAFLTAHGESPSAVTDLVQLLHEELDAAAAAQAVRDQARATAGEKEIPLAQYEAGVKAGTFSLAEFQDFLKAQKYGQDDIDTLVALMQSELDAAKVKADAKSKAAAKAKTKQINLPELERAVRLGLAPVSSYQAALVAVGEDPTSTDLLVGILKDQMAADTAAAVKRQEAALKAGSQGLSLAQAEQAVIDGVQPMSAYTLFLGKLGLNAADVDALRQLLQLRVDHQATVTEKQKAAEAKAAATSLSLGELQRATKLGVLSIDQYTGFLARIGVPPDDQVILRTSMLADLQKMAAANQTRTSAASRLAKQGLSLAQEEAAVIAGVESVDLFQSNLQSQGVSDSDIGVLVDLVTLKRDQAAAAADKRAQAEAKAADKDPSLAKEESLVTAGVITMDDYGAYLKELGLDDLDIAELEAALAQKIGLGQATAAAAGQAPAPGAKVKRARKKTVAPITPPATIP
jgi:hypothetical protein